MYKLSSPKSAKWFFGASKSFCNDIYGEESCLSLKGNYQMPLRTGYDSFANINPFRCADVDSDGKKECYFVPAEIGNTREGCVDSSYLRLQETCPPIKGCGVIDIPVFDIFAKDCRLVQNGLREISHCVYDTSACYIEAQTVQEQSQGIVGTPMQGVSPTIPGTPITTGTPGTPSGTVPGASCQVVTNNPNIDLKDYEPKKGEFDNQQRGGEWEFSYAGPSSVKVSTPSQINPDNKILYLRPSEWDESAQSFWTKPRDAIIPTCEGDKLLYPVDIVVAHLGGYSAFMRGTDNYKFLTYARYCALN